MWKLSNRKVTKLPFQTSNSRAAESFDKVHFDLWGPAPIISENNYRFYACFVDDNTHFIWFFL